MLLTGWNNTEWSNWQTLLSTGAGFESYSFPKSLLLIQRIYSFVI